MKIFCCKLVGIEPFSISLLHGSIFNSAQSFRPRSGMSIGMMLGMGCVEFTLFYPLFIKCSPFQREVDKHRRAVV